jgi:tetraacyldisaccharide 4'-kinase
MRAMTAPDFWWQRDSSMKAIALWPASKIWGAASSWRMARPPSLRPPVAVVCVGNFVVGGAGKTPAVLALARMARGRGFKPGILATGYGGRASGPVLVDPTIHRADHVGDEALLLAAAAPTVVARDRVAGARRLIDEGIDLIVMDDGFQNPSLAKDLSMIAVDAAIGIGNGLAMPAGPLRAPLGPQLRRADALIVIGEGEAAEPLIRAAARAGRGIVRARLRPVRVRAWRKHPILAFAGIGRPQKFFATLAEARAPVEKTLSFPDHHRFTESDAADLIAQADAGDLRLVTTEKDLVRLSETAGALGQLRQRAEAFAVTLEFENPAAIGEMIGDAVARAAVASG